MGRRSVCSTSTSEYLSLAAPKDKRARPLTLPSLWCLSFPQCRHHAKKAAASGFCYVNDAVLAILALRKPRRVTVVENSAERAHDVGAQPSTSNASTSAVSTSQQETSSGHTGRPKRPKTKLTRVQRIFYLDLDLHWGDGSSPFALCLPIFLFPHSLSSSRLTFTFTTPQKKKKKK